MLTHPLAFRPGQDWRSICHVDQSALYESGIDSFSLDAHAAAVQFIRAGRAFACRSWHMASAGRRRPEVAMIGIAAALLAIPLAMIVQAIEYTREAGQFINRVRR